MSISVKRVGITQRSSKLPTTRQPAQSAEHQIMMRKIGSYLSAPSHIEVILICTRRGGVHTLDVGTQGINAIIINCVIQ